MYGEEHKSFSATSLVPWLAGFAISKLLGPFFFWAAMAALIGVFLVGRVRKSATMPVRWAAGITLGQVGGQIFAVVMQPTMLGVVGLDIIFGVVLVVWLLLSLSRWPAGILAAFEVVALFVNARAMFQLPEWNHTMSVLLVHIILRLGIIYALAAGWRGGMRAPHEQGEALSDVFA